MSIPNNVLNVLRRGHPAAFEIVVNEDERGVPISQAQKFDNINQLAICVL
jgi:hypothetical protein